MKVPELPCSKHFRMGITMKNIQIREDIDQHMKELKAWLAETDDFPPEEMAAFFARRLDDYEEHMSIWKSAYERFAQLFPTACKNVLDLGCGTGLELDEIWKLCPDVCVTGVDLSDEMLGALCKKHESRYQNGQLKTVCQSYFDYEMGENEWDTMISFESLHHFFPDEKLGLYQKIYQGLKPGGLFLLGDYIACCEEEETLLRNMYLEKRKRFGVPQEQFIHIDIPLALEHEVRILEQAGFSEVDVEDSINGATILVAQKC